MKFEGKGEEGCVKAVSVKGKRKMEEQKGLFSDGERKVGMKYEGNVDSKRYCCCNKRRKMRTRR